MSWVVDFEVVLATGGSLLGALIGASAALWGQRQHWREQRRATAEEASQEAVLELCLRANTLDVAFRQAVLVQSSFTSLGGQLNRLIRIVAPLQAATVWDRVNREHELLLRAATRLRLTQDEETVRLTGVVLEAATRIVDAHGARASRRRSPLQFLLDLHRGRQFGDVNRLNEARRDLIEATASLQEHSRKNWGSPKVELLAPEPAALREH